MPNELLIATSNRGKIRELESLLSGLPVRLRLPMDFGLIPEPEEDGHTFAENAILKARYYAEATGLPALADDSGLEVKALGGAPGVRSARFGGRGATYAERMSALLERLAGVPTEGRAARFVCVIAVTDPAACETQTFCGVCEGSIADSPRGRGGFGYDPLFIPEGQVLTFGELPEEVKQTISHRARALQQAVEPLRLRFATCLDPLRPRRLE